MNINEFKNNFKGGARKNKFIVWIQGFNGTNEKFYKYLVQSTEVPAYTLESIEVNSLAGEIKVAGKRSVSDWSVTIILDEDSVNGIDVLENWQLTARKMLSAEGSNDAHNGINSYKKIASVTQLDQKGNPINTYTLEGVWVKEIGARSYDYSDDGIVTCDVTFSIDDVIHEEFRKDH